MQVGFRIDEAHRINSKYIGAKIVNLTSKSETVVHGRTSTCLSDTSFRYTSRPSATNSKLEGQAMKSNCTFAPSPSCCDLQVHLRKNLG